LIDKEVRTMKRTVIKSGSKKISADGKKKPQ